MWFISDKICAMIQVTARYTPDGGRSEAYVRQGDFYLGDRFERETNPRELLIAVLSYPHE